MYNVKIPKWKKRKKILINIVWAPSFYYLFSAGFSVPALVALIFFSRYSAIHIYMHTLYQLNIMRLNSRSAYSVIRDGGGTINRHKNNNNNNNSIWWWKRGHALSAQRRGMSSDKTPRNFSCSEQFIVGTERIKWSGTY